jgi:hypothetical protein
VITVKVKKANLKLNKNARNPSRSNSYREITPVFSGSRQDENEEKQQME